MTVEHTGQDAGAEFAAAKINLALHVVGRRADGYHELDSLVVFAEIGDSLRLAEPGQTRPLAIDGPFAAGLSDGDDNLVRRALGAAETLTGPLPPLALRLTKRLPIASGIGGGSADAAAALRLIARRAGLKTDDPRLVEIAAGLGADVPMCLASRPAHASGIGERLLPWPDVPRLPLVLVNPGVAVSTPAVFRQLARRDGKPIPRPPAAPDIDVLASWLGTETRNDLEAPAIIEAPAIAEALDLMRGCPACALARMSGSGATIFGLFPDMDSAAQTKDILAKLRPAWWVVATATGASPRPS